MVTLNFWITPKFSDLLHVGHSQFKVIQPLGHKRFTVVVFHFCICWSPCFSLEKILVLRFCIHHEKKKMKVNDKASLHSHIMTFEIQHWLGSLVWEIKLRYSTFFFVSLLMNSDWTAYKMMCLPEVHWDLHRAMLWRSYREEN